MEPLISFRLFAQRIRHMPVLRNAEGLWSLLRKPYLALLNARSKGVRVWWHVGLGPNAAVATGAVWEDYEPEAVAALVGWIRKHPGGQVLDVGSSIGILVRWHSSLMIAPMSLPLIQTWIAWPRCGASANTLPAPDSNWSGVSWGTRKLWCSLWKLRPLQPNRRSKANRPQGTWGQTDISAWIALTRRAFPAGEWMTSAREREIAFAPCSLNAMWRRLKLLVIFRIQAHSGGGECFPALERASTGAAELRTFRGRCEVLFEKH